MSLYETVPGCGDVTYLEVVTNSHLEYINYGECEMNISYNVKVPESAGRKKSDEAKALDSFLEMKDMRNMRFECADTDEGKKVCARLRSYQKYKGHQKLYKIFRLGQDVYVVKEDAGEEPDKVGVAKESKAKTSNTRKSSKRTGSIKAVS